MSDPFDCTVVVLTCDRADLLDCALRSLAAQTLLPRRVIVSDDSRDRSSEELTERIATANPRLCVLYRRGPRRGQSANLRSAMAMVSSEHVAVLHDDDWWDPSLMEAASRAFGRQPRPDVFVPGIRFVDLRGNQLNEETAALARRRDGARTQDAWIWHDAPTRARHLLGEQLISVFQGSVFRVAILRRWLDGPPRGDLEDLWLCADLARPDAGPLAVSIDPTQLCNYRVHRGSVASGAGSYMDSTIAAFCSFRDDADFAAIRPALAARVRERAFQAAVQETALGDRRRARALLREHCPAPRSRRERAIALLALVPSSALLRFALERRNARFDPR